MSIKFNTNDDVLAYSLVHHINYGHISKDTFLEDFKYFKVVARHIKKNGVQADKLPLVINNIIILNNLFSTVVTAEILKFLLPEYIDLLDIIYNKME